MTSFYSRTFWQKLGVFGFDAAIAALGFILAYFVRYEIAGVPAPDPWAVVPYTLLFALCAALAFYVMHTYRSIWRYTSFRDFLNLCLAVSIAVALFLPALLVEEMVGQLPRSVPLLTWLITIPLLLASRAAARLRSDAPLTGRTISARAGTAVPVLLGGLDSRGESFIREMINNRAAAYEIVGILSNEKVDAGRRVHGVPVLGPLDRLPVIMADLAQRAIQPQKLILSQSDLDGAALENLLRVGSDHGLSIARLPRLTDFYEGDGRMPLKPIALEDLLSRPAVSLDKASTESTLRGASVVITGGGGSIGSELVRQIARYAPGHLTLLDSSEYLLFQIGQEIRAEHPHLEVEEVLCDVRDRDTLFAHFNRLKPQVIFHAAALKHVPMMEDHPAEAVQTNVLGTRNVADAAREVKARAMLLVSTDKAVNPANVMGATKRIAECYCQSLDLLSGQSAETTTRFLTVRFGNVLGSNGSVVPLFQKQLEAGGPITVTHPDITRYFMTIPEAVELILQAITVGLKTGEDVGRIFVLDMGQPVRIADLAKKMIRLVGKRPGVDVEIKYIGLRPGEKLYEELMHEGEEPVPSTSDGLKLARPRAVDYELLTRTLNHLEQASLKRDPEEVKRLLSTLVPEYKSTSEAPVSEDLAPAVSERNEQPA